MEKLLLSRLLTAHLLYISYSLLLWIRLYKVADESRLGKTGAIIAMVIWWCIYIASNSVLISSSLKLE